MIEPDDDTDFFNPFPPLDAASTCEKLSKLMLAQQLSQA